MPYRKSHQNCSDYHCYTYSAYIRVKKKWVKAGEYNSKCRTFTPAEDVKTYDELLDEEIERQMEKNHYLRKLHDSMV